MISGENLVIGYWNCLAPGDNEEKRAYANALVEQQGLDVLVLTECRDSLAEKLKEDHHFVEYHRALTIGEFEEGQCVVASKPLKVDSYPNAQKLAYANRIDTRQTLRIKHSLGGAATLAVHATHITHPQHCLRNPRLNVRRLIEWRTTGGLLQEDTENKTPWVWLADTNTFLAATVSRRLKLAARGGKLLDHEGGATWGRKPGAYRRYLYLDRAAASVPLLEEAGYKARLTTIKVVGDLAIPSDHQPIVVTISPVAA